MNKAEKTYPSSLNLPRTGSIILWMLVLLIAFLLTACLGEGEEQLDGDNDLPSEQDEQSDGDGMQDGDLELDLELGEPIDPEALSGLWAMKFSLGYTTVLPILQCKVQMLLSGVAKIHARMEGNEFIFTEEICDMGMNIVEDMDFYVIFSSDSINATGINPRQATFSEMAVGATFQTTPAHDLYGLDESLFDDPINDELPHDADDPRVIDFDDDGHPGLTSQVLGFVKGEVYVIMRMMRDMTGLLINEGLVEGSINSSVEMITLGADPEYIAFQLDLQHYDDPLVNHFEMIKLDEDLACPVLYEREAEFFAYDPHAVATPMWTGDCPKEEGR